MKPIYFVSWITLIFFCSVFGKIHLLVDNAYDYIYCPNIAGTHYDWRLDVESRVEYLIAHTSLAQKVSQVRFCLK